MLLSICLPLSVVDAEHAHWSCGGGVITDELIAAFTADHDASVIHVVLPMAVFARSLTVAAHGQLIARHVAFFIAIRALGIVSIERRWIVKRPITHYHARGIVDTQHTGSLLLHGIDCHTTFHALVVLEIVIAICATTDTAEKAWCHGIHGRRQGGIQVDGVVVDEVGPVVAVFKFRIAAR